MAGKSCSCLVLVKGDAPPVRLDIDAESLNEAFEKLDAILDGVERRAPGSVAKASAPGDPLSPLPRTPILTRGLADLLSEAARNAAKADNFRKPLAAALERALASTTQPKLKKALREALERVRKGKYLTNPPKTDIEAIARLLSDEQKWQLLGHYGTAMHQATFDLIRKSLAPGYRLITDKPLRNLLETLSNAEIRERLGAFHSMSVRDYVKNVFSNAIPGSKGAAQDEAFIRAFGEAGSKDAMREVKLLDLKPDVVIVNAENQVEAVLDLTSLSVGTMRQASVLARDELMQIESWRRRLANLSPDEAMRVILSEATDETTEILLSKSKFLHAMRGAMVQDFLGRLGVAIRGLGGEFYYEALMPWGKPKL